MLAQRCFASAANTGVVFVQGRLRWVSKIFFFSYLDKPAVFPYLLIQLQWPSI